MNVQTDCPRCHRFAPHDECPPPPETVTLPHTFAVVPAAAAALTIKPTGSLQTSGGEAFTADVLDGKTRLGVIEQDGRGGGTYFLPFSPDARARWDALVDEYAAIDEDHRWVAHEALCNDLYEEVALPRDLNRKRNAVVRVTVAEPEPFMDDFEIFTVNAPLSDSVRDWARRTYEGRNPLVWIKGEGWSAA